MKLQRINKLLPQGSQKRRGAFVVMGIICLSVCLCFVAFSVDIGYISLTKTRMQNAADSAALAAAMEITHSVQTAPQGTTDMTTHARTSAAAKAAEVALLNGFYLNGLPSGGDVHFGRRAWDPVTEEFIIDWNIGATENVNCLKVIIRKDNADASQPDAKLPLFFAGIFGTTHSELRAEATSYVESRDIVVTHDFSRSMNFDSHFTNEAASRLSRPQLANSALEVWDDFALPASKVGNLPRIPEYLTVSDTDEGVTASVNFKYDDAYVTSSHEIERIKLYYDSGSSTFNDVGATSMNVDGSSNISRVEVKSIKTPSVPIVGSPWSDTQYDITLTIDADRLNYDIVSTGPRQLVKIETYFQSGGKNSYNMSNPYPYSHSISESSEIAYVKVRYKKNNSYYWRTYNNPEPESGWTDPEYVTQNFYDNNSNVKTAFGLDGIAWPYPNGGSWDGYIDHCRTYSNLEDNDADASDTDFREKFGGITFANYMIRYHSSHYECPDLMNARHYPFHAIKLGHLQMCDFLGQLGFNDHLGMVSYDASHRQEMVLNESGLPYVDISANPLCTDYAAVANLMRYKQADHYSSSTNIGGGLRDSIAMLDSHKRVGARHSILLMTDGNANTTDGTTTMPSGWESWFDGFDGPGSTYSVSHDGASSSVQNARKQLFYEVKRAVDKKYTIHTMAVGADADWKTMKAIAFLGKGEFIHVNGGTSSTELEAQLAVAFHKISGLVPPAKLLTGE